MTGESDVRERFGITVECCESCHEDLDQGWNASTIEVDGKEVSVCCAVARTFRSIVSEVKLDEREGHDRSRIDQSKKDQ